MSNDTPEIIYSLFDKKISPALTTVLCAQQDPTDRNLFTVWAYWVNGVWYNVDGIASSNQTLGNAERFSGYFMQTFAQTVAGFTYYMLHSFDDNTPRPQAQATLKRLAFEHDRLINVPPQEEVDQLLAMVSEHDQICLGLTIDFAKRLYTLTLVKPHGGMESGYNTVLLNPLGFDAALKKHGYRMIDPPAHIKGWLYKVLIVRDDQPERHLITEETDLQNYQAKEAWLGNRFVTQLAYA